jgi:hypothetical protein
MNRPQISDEVLEQAIRGVLDKLNTVISTKGRGSFASSHEIWGVLEEEVDEYKTATITNEFNARKIDELRDIAVVAIFAIASIEGGHTDW